MPDQEQVRTTEPLPAIEEVYEANEHEIPKESYEELSASLSSVADDMSTASGYLHDAAEKLDSITSKAADNAVNLVANLLSASSRPAIDSILELIAQTIKLLHNQTRATVQSAPVPPQGISGLIEPSFNKEGVDMLDNIDQKLVRAHSSLNILAEHPDQTRSDPEWNAEIVRDVKESLEATSNSLDNLSGGIRSQVVSPINNTIESMKAPSAGEPKADDTPQHPDSADVDSLNKEAMNLYIAESHLKRASAYLAIAESYLPSPELAADNVLGRVTSPFEVIDAVNAAYDQLSMAYDNVTSVMDHDALGAPDMNGRLTTAYHNIVSVKEALESERATVQDNQGHLKGVHASLLGERLSDLSERASLAASTARLEAQRASGEPVASQELDAEVDTDDIER